MPDADQKCKQCAAPLPEGSETCPQCGGSAKKRTAPKKPRCAPAPAEALPDENAPTQAQLDYARDLGIDIPGNATKADLSALLDKKLEEDGDPNIELVEFAARRDMEFSAYIGKKRLYNLVFSKLSPTDQIAFFCFSIYRYLSEDRHANLDTSPHRDLFFAFGKEHENDPKFLKSLGKYQGQDLRYFGTLRVKTESGSFTTTGGSAQTFAFKTARAFLDEHFELPKSTSKTIDRAKEDEEPVRGATCGCLVMLFVLACLGGFGFWVFS